MGRRAVAPLDIAIARVRVPLWRPFVTAAGRATARESWIVRLRRADRTGYGEVALDPAASRSEVAALERKLRDLVAAAPATAGEIALPIALLAGRPAPLRAGLDAALLGVGALPPGRPTAGSVAVNATIDGDVPDRVVATALTAVAAGFHTLKLKGGTERSPTELAERIGAVRAAVGPTVRLRLDVNGSWDLAGARAAGEALAPFDLDYIEQPVAARPAGRALAVLAELRRAMTIPIALDESVIDEAAARAIVAAGAADVLVVKPARVGGVRASLAIAELAASHGVRAVVSTLLETGIGLSAGLAVAGALGSDTAHGLATGDRLESDLLIDPIRAASGRIAVPDLAALGVDDDAVRRFAVETMGTPW